MTEQPEKPRGSKVVRKRLADGTIKEYTYDRAPRRRKLKKEHGAIKQLADLYARSPEFNRLSKKWQSAKHYYLRLLETELAWMTVDDLNDRESRGDFYELRDQFSDMPDKADKLLDTLKAMLGWAYERNKIKFNHALGIPHLAKSGKRRSEEVWSEDQEAIVYACLPRSLVEGFRFCLFTAMRQADMCALRWTDYKDGWITYRQLKTGALVHIPVYALPPLQDLVDGLSRCSEFMFTTETGHPWKVENLRVRWRDWKLRTEIKHMNRRWHDLRGTCITRLQEAGCTDAETAAISGHSIGSGTKLGDYTARSKQFSLNAYQKWRSWLAQKPQILPFGNRSGNR